MMTYSVKEIFKTIQGEGMFVGRVAVFLRFSGCNLWTGREEDRASAICQFCDTDFVGGTKYQTASELSDAVETEWAADNYYLQRFVVITGGEPLLQFDTELFLALQRKGFFVAIETNGTVVPNCSEKFYWVCVSPKAGSQLAIRRANEVKLVYPQRGIDPERIRQEVSADNYFLQPMDGPQKDANTQSAIAYCLENPRWRLSLQTHKLTGMR